MKSKNAKYARQARHDTKHKRFKWQMNQTIAAESTPNIFINKECLYVYVCYETHTSV